MFQLTPQSSEVIGRNNELVHALVHLTTRKHHHQTVMINYGDNRENQQKAEVYESINLFNDILNKVRANRYFIKTISYCSFVMYTRMEDCETSWISERN